MMTHRTNVLLDSQTKAILDYLVAKKKKTAGSIIREFLLKEGKKHKLGMKSEKNEMSIEEIIMKVHENAKKINSKGIDYEEMKNYGRKYI